MFTHTHTHTHTHTPGLIKTIKDAEDEGGTRKLAKHFLSLPNKDEMPEYYEIIKRPVRLSGLCIHLHTLDALGCSLSYV